LVWCSWRGFTSESSDCEEARLGMCLRACLGGHAVVLPSASLSVWQLHSCARLQFWTAPVYLDQMREWVEYNPVVAVAFSMPRAPARGESVGRREGGTACNVVATAPEGPVDWWLILFVCGGCCSLTFWFGLTLTGIGWWGWAGGLGGWVGGRRTDRANAHECMRNMEGGEREGRNGGGIGTTSGSLTSSSTVICAVVLVGSSTNNNQGAASCSQHTSTHQLLHAGCWFAFHFGFLGHGGQDWQTSRVGINHHLDWAPHCVPACTVRIHDQHHRHLLPNSGVIRRSTTVQPALWVTRGGQPNCPEQQYTGRSG
jgi:hypothetical protein